MYGLVKLANQFQPETFKPETFNPETVDGLPVNTQATKAKGISKKDILIGGTIGAATGLAGVAVANKKKKEKETRDH